MARIQAKVWLTVGAALASGVLLSSCGSTDRVANTVRGDGSAGTGGQGGGGMGQGAAGGAGGGGGGGGPRTCASNGSDGAGATAGGFGDPKNPTPWTNPVVQC